MRWSCSPSCGRRRSARPRRRGWRWRWASPSRAARPSRRRRCARGARCCWPSSPNGRRRAARRRWRSPRRWAAPTGPGPPPAIGALRSAPLGRPWRGSGLEVWSRLTEWEDQAPPGEAGSKPVDPQDAARRLAALLDRAGLDEARPTQAEFAAETAFAFGPRDKEGEPQADAGRGRHRRRQDAGLPRAGLALGRGQRPGGVGLDLHPGAAAADRARKPRGLPGPGDAGQEGGGAQGPRELPVPVEPAGVGERLAARRRRPGRAWRWSRAGPGPAATAT